jgi:hypothetical protein
MKRPVFVPTWSELKTIGKSRLARATIFFPIIGYLVLYNERISTYLRLIPGISTAIHSNTASGTNIDEATLTRIIAIYVGLFFIGVASTLFVLLCPKDIFDHDDEHHFIMREIDLMTPLRFDFVISNLGYLQGIATPRLSSEIKRLSQIQLSDSIGTSQVGTELGARGLLWSDWINRNKKELSTSLSILYTLRDQSRWSGRIIISAIYFIGFIYLLWPSAIVFAGTCNVLIEKLRSFFL